MNIKDIYIIIVLLVVHFHRRNVSEVMYIWFKYVNRLVDVIENGIMAELCLGSPGGHMTNPGAT